MKLSTLMLFFITAQLNSVAQTTLSDEQLVLKIADKVIERHQVGFVDKQSKEVYATTEQIPHGASVYLKSHTMDWHYATGVLNMAMIRASKLFNRAKYFNFAVNQIDFCLNNYKFFEQHKDAQGNAPYHFLWQFRELDHCGAEVAAMLDVMHYDSSKIEYRPWVEKTANHILNLQERTKDRTLVRSWPHSNTLWADDLYMGLVFLARQGKYSGEKYFFDDAVRQVDNFNKYLWNPAKQLYYHAYFNDIESVGGAHWGRCNGWVMLATTHLIDAMPQGHRDKERMIGYLKRHILGVSRYQAFSGMWHQLLDKPDSYSESSCTSIFVYCVAKAINSGWLDARYASIAIQGWQALRQEKLNDNGDLKDICVGTGIGNDLGFYYQRKKVDNEVHGLGLVLDAAMEMIELNKRADKR